MSNKIQRQIKENIVDKEKLTQYKPVIGQVIWTDIYNNRCHIRIPNMLANKKGSANPEDTHILLRHVPISFHTGVYNAGPFENDQVWVGFQNNDIKMPFIMGHADTRYMDRTRKERMENGMKGSFLGDTSVSKKDNIKGNKGWSPIGQYGKDWSKDLQHYAKTLKPRATKDPKTASKASSAKAKIRALGQASIASVNAVLQDVKNSQYKHQSEVGIFHPYHQSGIKIKDNAQIDLFTYPHQGIRIDPDTRSINTHSEWMKAHHNEWRAWIKGQAQWRVNGNYVCDVKGSHQSYANGTYTVQSRKSDVRIKAAKTVYVDASDIVLTAKGSVSIKAGSHIGLKAPRIDWN